MICLNYSATYKTRVRRPTDRGFIERLRKCVEAAGGKRALSMKTGVSEAQLYRYLAGTADPTLTALRTIAEGMEIEIGWLASGIGKPPIFI